MGSPFFTLPMKVVFLPVKTFKMLLPFQLNVSNFSWKRNTSNRYVSIFSDRWLFSDLYAYKFMKCWSYTKNPVLWCIWLKNHILVVRYKKPSFLSVLHYFTKINAITPPLSFSLQSLLGGCLQLWIISVLYRYLLLLFSTIFLYFFLFWLCFSVVQCTYNTFWLKSSSISNWFMWSSRSSLTRSGASS